MQQALTKKNIVQANVLLVRFGFSSIVMNIYFMAAIHIVIICTVWA